MCPKDADGMANRVDSDNPRLQEKFDLGLRRTEGGYLMIMFVSYS